MFGFFRELKLIVIDFNAFEVLELLDRCLGLQVSFGFESISEEDLLEHHELAIGLHFEWMLH